MTGKLYLLVASERPDTYLNSVMHCVLITGVRSVEFIFIEGWQGARPQSETRAQAVSRRVAVLLEDLVDDGEYRDFVKTERIDLGKLYSESEVAVIRDLYRQCRDMRVNWGQKDIPYAGLRKELRRIARENSHNIVDVTGVKKTFLGDLVAVSVVEGLENLCIFELIESPDFKRPWSMLFHEVRSTGDRPSKYNYTNIIDTDIFKECSRSLLIRRPTLKWAVLISVVLFLTAIGLYYLPGASNWFRQGLLISASVASLLSLLYTFVPIRGS